MPSHIYLLSSYANTEHLEDQRGAREHVSSITYNENGIVIELSETNSLVEDKYSMNIHTGSYAVEGTNESREAMIHHHPTGHEEKHLQFKLQSNNKVIRIILPMLDKEDYKRCIKGFIYTTKRIIEYEKEELETNADLINYFFNENIEELSADRTFLVERIQQASTKVI